MYSIKVRLRTWESWDEDQSFSHMVAPLPQHWPPPCLPIKAVCQLLEVRGWISFARVPPYPPWYPALCRHQGSGGCNLISVLPRRKAQDSEPKSQNSGPASLHDGCVILGRSLSSLQCLQQWKQSKVNRQTSYCCALLYWAFQTLHFQQIEGLWQPRVEQGDSSTVCSNSICSLRVSV